ncbi:MAG: nitrous oxide-stimulated promoter family protein [Candidatus Zixiibacteriota bacterium]|nr:MAG: nitrous oxide-stimulated promoter family protein [candidate division Zixibacteria bacterium]
MSDPKEQNRIGIDKKIRSDVKVLARFIQIFCANNHSADGKQLVQAKGRTGEFLKGVSVDVCDDCRKLLLHGAGKRIICPYDPKPRCKRCPTYCFRDGYRERVREVMRFSGAYLIKRGRLDLAFKYFF